MDEMNYLAPNTNLALDLMRATEAAALAAGRWAGRGQKEQGDGAAVVALRQVLNGIPMRGTIVIGEGEKDEAPMLANGEQVGNGQGPEIDIAVDPVDGTRLLAWGMRNSIAVLAATQGGAMYNPTECFYMDKLAVGAEGAEVIDLSAPIGENVRRVARAKGMPVSDLTVAVLNRDRHQKLVEEIRAAGAMTRMITDGDVAAAVAAAIPDSGIDLVAGIGGSPEGVVMACAMICLGGRIQAQLHPTSEQERERTVAAGHDPDQVLDTHDLVRSDQALFVATGITEGDLLRAVRYLPGGSAQTHSVVMRSSSGTVRYVRAIHQLGKVNKLMAESEAARELADQALASQTREHTSRIL